MGIMWPLVLLFRSLATPGLEPEAVRAERASTQEQQWTQLPARTASPPAGHAAPRPRLGHGGRPWPQPVLSLRAALATSGEGIASLPRCADEGAKPGEAGWPVPRPQAGAAPRASGAPASGGCILPPRGRGGRAFPQQGHPGGLPGSVVATALGAQPLRLTHPLGDSHGALWPHWLTVEREDHLALGGGDSDCVPRSGPAMGDPAPPP